MRVFQALEGFLCRLLSLHQWRLHTTTLGLLTHNSGNYIYVVGYWN